MGKSQDLYVKAKTLIPGGTQLLSKRPEQFLPNLWPSYYSKAKGCDVWDLDGKQYKDFSYMGIGANVLGYADEDVNAAVKQAVDDGSMCTLNAPEEVELAEVLCELHPWADMVRYAKSGGESGAIAIRIARAYTRKDIVLFCGYHGWHDWYLASNLGDDNTLEGHLLPGLSPAGVPKNLKGTSFPFAYNDQTAFDQLIETHRGKIAAVIMEPIRNYEPVNGFLEHIRAVTEQEKIVLVFDEISAGFRLCCGGSHLVFGVDPDMALLGKAISNGYPMAAVIGRGIIMQAAQDTFISSTYFTDRVGLVAALATIRKFKDLEVEKILIRNGEIIEAGWKQLAEKHGLEIKTMGIKPLVLFSIKSDHEKEIKTLFIQEMLERGFLSTMGYYASLEHRSEDIAAYLSAVDDVFAIIAKALQEGNIKAKIKNEVCHSGFKRLT